MSNYLDEIDAIIDEPAMDMHKSTVEKITDILAGDDDEIPEGVAAEEQAGDSETEEAEAAEVETPSVDYALEVPLQDGSKIKLGELKDHYQSAQKHQMEVIERENAVMARMAELSELAQHVQLPPQAVQQIRQQQERYLLGEHQRMLEAIPEFKDATVFTQAKQAIQELGAEYGIADQIGQISDHRIVKLLHDYARLRGQIKAAKENVKPLRSSEPAAKQKAVVKPDQAAMAAKQARTSGNIADQIKAISALIK